MYGKTQIVTWHFRMWLLYIPQILAFNFSLEFSVYNFFKTTTMTIYFQLTWQVKCMYADDSIRKFEEWMDTRNNC